MNKILPTEEAITLSNILRTEGKKIVIAGGCFDILHIGHIKYLKSAEAKGDVLFVLLESDENIKKSKGNNRPINSERDRASVLENLAMIDHIVIMSEIKKDDDYDRLVISLKPAIIAITKGDLTRVHKERQAKAIGARLLEVTEQVSNQSTSKLIEILKEI